MNSQNLKRCAVLLSALSLCGLSACSDESAGQQGNPCRACTETQKCISNQCIDLDKVCGETVCLDTQKCIADSCVELDKVCGETACTDTQTCLNDKCVETSELCGGKTLCTGDEVCTDGVCKVPDPEVPKCGDAICSNNEVCFNLACVDPAKLCASGTELCGEDETCFADACTPTASICGVTSCDLSTEECVEGSHCEPIDPCRNVTCPIDGQKCDNGECRDRKICEDITCNDDQTCAATIVAPLGQCIDTRCTEDAAEGDHKIEKVCPENQMCIAGECVDDGCVIAGVPMTCDEGWECHKGECLETKCIGVVCDAGRSCSEGQCYDDECLPLDEHVCPEGQTCAKGDCIFDACLDKEPCKQGKVCIEDGTCAFDVAPAIESESTDDNTTDESGKTLTIELVLNNEPASEITLTCEVITADGIDDEVITNCAELAITAENWMNPQYIILTGVADHIVDGDQDYQVKITTHSEEAEFNGLTYTTDTFKNLDIDKAEIKAVDAENLMTNENGTTATFSLVFASKPSAPVTIKLTSSNTAEGIVSSVGGNEGTEITLSPEDWDKPIEIVLKGVDDDAHDPDSTYEISFAVTSEDTNYNGIEIPAIKVTNGDNDSPGATLSAAELQTSEAPTSANFSFELTTKPTADVNVTLAVTKNADEVTLSKTSLTISKDNWHAAQEITVTGVADNIIDPDEPFEITLTFASEDKDYNFTKVITGVNKNTDTASFVLPVAATSTVSESGTSQDFQFSLSSKPTAAVTIKVTTNDASETSVAPATITIAPEKWNELQKVTVTGVDDNLVDGPQKSTITLTVSDTTDTNFKNLALAAWTVTTEDNDNAAIILSKNTVTVAENAGTDTFTVKLAAQPEKENVTITLASNNTGALTVSPATLTFTSSNWNTAQTVTVTGVDNQIADLNGQRSAVVSLTSASSDAIFNGLTQSVAATITDNDSPGINVTVDSALLNQASKTTTMRVSLGMEPASNVTVTVTPNSNVFSLATSTFTFTPANWQTAQTTTVTANPAQAENAWTYGTLTGKATSTNAYNGKTATANIKFKYVETVTGGTNETGEVVNCSSSATLLPGRYKLQVWGASGGDGYNNDQNVGSHGGLGGYAEGILTLTSRTTVYMHYGTAGSIGTYTYVGANAKGKGCNGGGGGTAHSNGSRGYGGGGASDIRLISDTVNHRVIVAGGGGGADNATGEGIGGGDDGSGGFGGGATGGYGRANGVANQVAPGTQTSGAGFGQGATYGGNYDIGGGGGGWYGGYTAGGDGNTGGGGGSGFVLTSNTIGNVPASYQLKSSAYYLTSASTTPGNAAFPNTSGSANETGHKGNGYVKITLIE